MIDKFFKTDKYFIEDLKNVPKNVSLSLIKPNNSFYWMRQANRIDVLFQIGIKYWIARVFVASFKIFEKRDWKIKN